MKRIISTVLILMCTVTAFAQGSVLKQTLEIVELEVNDRDNFSVFDMPEEGQHHYYLNVGTLGIGDDFVQLQIDPIFQLFIPLGNTLEEALAKLEEFKSIAKSSFGTELETPGTLALGNPSTGETETVYVTARRTLFRRMAEFSVHRNRYVRATYVTKTELGSLISGVKLYMKIHPNEQ